MFKSSLISLKMNFEQFIDPYIAVRKFGKKQIVTEEGTVENYFNFIIKGLARKYYKKGKDGDQYADILRRSHPSFAGIISQPHTFRVCCGNYRASLCLFLSRTMTWKKLCSLSENGTSRPTYHYTYHGA